ncbi:DJ-1/PfpI family protein [Collinsella sp. AGMB00827]|uniref:DJ-1/PfpI family protein n=1 Tax=Collinsella ureilytica TaxID=2869515 RepID=A0ABS7MHX0_9ACTN|nr:DJ-1 family glyoxalase III [Collinsella urealyticum]MBY4796959.1 DJ-1/PfpI family protein [Collinsella urealyticum]
MSAVLILAADGFETIECLTILDVLRRGGVRTSLVSTMDTRECVSAQQVTIACDFTLDEINPDDYDWLILPGGMPGTTHLRNDPRVCALVEDFAINKHVGAICAAPSILGELGLLIGKRATCFPGFEESFPAGTYAGSKTVVVDGNLITASAMGQALPFALAVLESIAGKKAVEKVREGIQL